MAQNSKPRKPPADDAPTTADTVGARPVIESESIAVPSKTLIDTNGQPLRKKKKRVITEAPLIKWSALNRGEARDAMIQGQSEAARQKLGHSAVWVGGQADGLIIGIPIPALPMEYLIGLDIFPLGLVVQLVAETGTGKTGLVAEIARWFDRVGGYSNVVEAESKMNYSWYRSIMGEKAASRVQFLKAATLEEWQRGVTFFIHDNQVRMKGTAKNPGPGRMFPVQIAVDAISSRQSERIQEKIFGAKQTSTKKAVVGDGAANLTRPINANLNTIYFTSAPAKFDDWPFSLVLVNHLKLARDDKGNTIRTKPGGAQIGFQQSFEIELSRIGGVENKLRSADWEGIPVALKVYKSSFSPGQRRIETRVLWWQEEREDGSWRQRTAWDWDWSTVHLLNSILSGAAREPYKRSLLKAADFHLECPSSSPVENLAWSKSVGMAASDAAPWTEVGELIRKDKPLVEVLRKALMIECRRKFPDGEHDYAQIQEQARKELP